MSSTFGNKIKVSIFGQSHSEGIGVTLDGIPAGVIIDMEKLQSFMDRRAPGKAPNSTARTEGDVPEFLSGVLPVKTEGHEGSEATSLTAGGASGLMVTCGAPISAIIRNNDVKSADYDEIKNVPRPGHADFTAHIKYEGYEDYRGGGHFSGRLTAPLCVAGGIALQILESLDIKVSAKIDELGGVKIGAAGVGEPASEPAGSEDGAAAADAEQINSLIEAARAEGDSIGGIIKCTVNGIHAGVGDPIFDGVENRISQVVFGIPAVKGIEFGAGFGAAALKGSENNDPFDVDEAGNMRPTTNNAGGILGGITTGADIIFRVAIKPTPSISKAQRTAGYDGEIHELVVNGRHDPCIVPRALPAVEAATALALLDLII